MLILYGFLLAVTYFILGWLLFEIPYALIAGLINKLRFGIFDVNYAGPTANYIMKSVQIVVLGGVSIKIGIDPIITAIAIGLRGTVFILTNF